MDNLVLIQIKIHSFLIKLQIIDNVWYWRMQKQKEVQVTVIEIFHVQLSKEMN